MNAIIYVRVSSADQVEGTSLQSQEIACREYATKHDLSVVRVFVEQGESAKFADRTQLLQLLNYCQDKANAVSVLIVWKLDRFARNVEDHFAIKATLRRHGVSVVSVTEPIAADPNGKLLETILAGFAAFDNDVRSIRTVQGLQQRIRDGLFPWKPPLGYLPPKIGRKTVADSIDPVRFEPLRKAWELFGTGAYAKADIVRLLASWGVTSYRRSSITPQMLDFIFQNPYYAGIVRDPWTGAEYTGRHEPMVSPALFARVQQIILQRNNSQPHHRANASFPLRGLVRCPACARTLTGAYSRGRSRRYAYYSCWNRTCHLHGRSVPVDTIHRDFLDFLAAQSVAPAMCRATLAAVRDLLATEAHAAKQASVAVAEGLRALEHQAEELVSMRARRLLSDEEFSVARDRLRQRQHELQATAIATPDRWLGALDEASLAASLQDVPRFWASVPVSHRRRFEELLLPAGYIRGAVRTAERGLLFRVFSPSREGESNVAALVTSNLNQLFEDISKFMAILRVVPGRHEPLDKAA